MSTTKINTSQTEGDFVEIYCPDCGKFLFSASKYTDGYIEIYCKGKPCKDVKGIHLFNNVHKIGFIDYNK